MNYLKILLMYQTVLNNIFLCIYEFVKRRGNIVFTQSVCFFGQNNMIFDKTERYNPTNTYFITLLIKLTQNLLKLLRNYS